MDVDACGKVGKTHGADTRAHASHPQQLQAPQQWRGSAAQTHTGTDKRMLMDPLALRLSSNMVRRRSQEQLFVGNCQIFMSHVDQTGQKSI